MKLNTQPLSDVKVGQPIIADGTYFARLKLTVGPNKAKTGNNIVVKARIISETLTRRDTSEEFQNKGITLTRWVSLVTTDNYNPDESVKLLALACGHEGDDVELEDIDGKYVKINVGYAPASGQYNESNDIKKFVKIVPEDGFNEPA